MNFHDALIGTDELDRRAFAGCAARTLLGVGLSPLLASFLRAQDPQAPVPAAPRGPARARSVIYCFLRGGLSQLDTFDPKPGKATQGPVSAIGSKADGVQVSQYLPALAAQMDKVCVISSMSSTQGAHSQAQYLTRTSYELRGTIQHPSLGAWTNRLGGRINPNLPGHVLLGGSGNMPTAGFFPPEYLALPIDDPKQGLQHSTLPKGITETAFDKRLQRLQHMNDTFAKAHSQYAVKAYADMYADAVRLMRSSDLAAFDLEQEGEAMRAAYGDSTFGQGCLLARRLVEHGVRFVEVMSDGWDTHADNFDRLEEQLPAVDHGLAALLADLDARGLLEETIVVVATEFGRTPDIDNDKGRNHYPKAFSCLLAGGGIRGGQRHGATSADGREVIADPVTIQDFNATVAYALGLQLDLVVTSPSGRPFKIADKGRPITSLFA
jgi:hypothetical protein